VKASEGKTKRKGVEGWRDTEITCKTYAEFAARASSGQIDADNWFFTYYNHGRVKTSEFDDEDKMVYTVNTWVCKSHGEGKRKDGTCCPAQVEVVVFVYSFHFFTTSLCQLQVVKGKTQWNVFAKGQHLDVLSNKRQYGIDPLLLPLIEDALNKDALPGTIERLVRELKVKASHKYGRCQTPTSVQISNHRAVMRLTKSGVFAYQQISRVKEEFLKHIKSRGAFDAMDPHLPEQMTLGIVEEEVLDTIKNEMIIQYGVVYSAKGKRNILHLLT